MAVESSKVVSDVPKRIYDRLEQLKNERGLHSVSQAVNFVLEDYFGLDTNQSVISQHLTQAVENLKSEVANLKKQVSGLQQITSTQSGELTGLKSQSELLNQKQLAERLKVDIGVINQRQTDGKEFTEWSRRQDPEHIAWKYTEANLFRRI